MAKSADGTREADTSVSAGDLIKESWLFQSPSQYTTDAKLAERLLKMKADSGRARSQVDVLGRERGRYRDLARRHEVAAQNISPEQARIRSAATSSAMQRLRDEGAGTDAGSTLRAALRTAKARQGIIQRGDAAIKGQRLKDRLGFVRGGIKRRARAIDLQGAGEQIAAGVNLSAQRAADAMSAARWGTAGAAAGAFGGILKGNKDNNGSMWDFGKKNTPKSTGRNDGGSTGLGGEWG
jgi:hypothetical protein